MRHGVKNEDDDDDAQREGRKAADVGLAMLAH